MTFLIRFLPLLLIICFTVPGIAASQPKNLHLVILGDSLTAGYGLKQEQSFPARLEQALRKRGWPITVTNAGVSGDTTAGGLARLQWTLSDEPDLVLIELGANDALRGQDPARTEANLDAILTRIKEHGASPILAGMRAPRNLGTDYVRQFDGVFPRLAEKHQVPLYPFFLDGVAGRTALNLTDGIHPNEQGVEVIVEGILPVVENALNKVGRKQGADSNSSTAAEPHRSEQDSDRE